MRQVRLVGAAAGSCTAAAGTSLAAVGGPRTVAGCYMARSFVAGAAADCWEDWTAGCIAEAAVGCIAEAAVGAVAVADSCCTGIHPSRHFGYCYSVVAG